MIFRDAIVHIYISKCGFFLNKVDNYKTGLQKFFNASVVRRFSNTSTH